MALAGPLLGTLIMSEFAAKGFTGSQNQILALAIGNGVINYIMLSNYYQGTATGIGTGAGVGTGFVTGVVGPITGGLIYTEMTSAGLSGTKALDISMAVGSAFATHIATGIVSSASTPVANGVGVGSILGVVGGLMGGSILAMMSASGLTGTQTVGLAMAIGNGIATAISSAVVTTTIVGAGYPPSPLTGVDIGKLT